MERTKFRQEGLGEETEFLKDTCPAPPGAVDQVEECQPTNHESQILKVKKKMFLDDNITNIP